MLPEFFTTDELRDWRSWRPEQPSQLLGVPDAVLTIRGEEPVLAFLRWRVEAAETTVGFRAHEDRPEKMGLSWNSFEYVLYEAIDTASAAYQAFDNLAPPEAQEPQEPHDPEPWAKPIYRLDDGYYFRCPACGQISRNETHFKSDTCPRRLSAPFRVEQHRWGYRVANRNGLRLADLFHAYWALPLAIALTGRRLAAFDGTLADEDHQDGASRPTSSPPHLRVVSATGGIADLG